jgi:hypothetical protein
VSNQGKLQWVRMLLAGPQPEEVLRPMLADYLSQLRKLPDETAQAGIDQIIEFVIIQVQKHRAEAASGKQIEQAGP